MRNILVLAILFLLPFASALTSISSCTNISYSDEFVLTGNLFGNNTYAPWSIAACIYIYNSDVTIDCDGNSITGNESGSTYGIWINPNLKNITIKDCNGISNYSTGILFYTDVNDSVINNNTIFNTGTGIFVNDGSCNNVFSNNYLYSNGLGMQLGYMGDRNNLIANNTAINNTNSGFVVVGVNNTLINNSAIENGYAGIWFITFNSSHFNNTASYNSVMGIYLSGVSNNTFAGTVSSSNDRGLYIADSAANNTFFNSTAFNNSIGFEVISGANNNIFTNNLIYGSSGYGVSMNWTTFGNNFTNTFIYNQTYYVNQQGTASSPNNFNNLTLGYNSTIGLVNYPFINFTGINLDPTRFLLQPDWVSLDTANAQEANVSATITLNTSDCGYVVLRKEGFPASFGDIFANGTVYAAAISCASGVAVFSVSSFSGYALGPSLGCANLSDSTTWSGRIVNDSATGTLYVNQNTTLCRDYYYRDVPGDNYSLRMNASNIHLDCNGSVIDGVDDTGVGLRLYMVENDTITNCTLKDYRFGFYLQAGSNRNLFISDNATSTWDYGFLDEFNHNNTILYSSVSSANGNGFGMGGNDGLLRNSVAYGAFSAGAAALVQGDRVVIDNLIASGAGNFGVSLFSVDNCAIENSTISGYARGIYSDSSGNNRFAYNDITGAGTAGVYSTNSRSNTLVSNAAHGNAGTGFYLEYSNSSVLDNNSAYGNNLGFSIYYSHNGIFSNTTAHGNNQNGFFIWDSSWNNFTDTVVHSNGNNALALQSNSINQFTNTLIYGQSAYMYVLSSCPTNFTNLTLGYNSSIGLVNYPSMNTTTNTIPFEGGNVHIQPDWVSINPAAADIGQAVSAAYITINNSDCAGLGVMMDTGFPGSYAEILADGTHYPSARTCNGDLATFYVTGFSGYTLGQEATTITSFTATPGSPVDVGTETNIFCGASNPEVILEIYINGTLVQSGNGSIWYDEAVSSGARFAFTLPLSGSLERAR